MSDAPIELDALEIIIEQLAIDVLVGRRLDTIDTSLATSASPTTSPAASRRLDQRGGYCVRPAA